METGETEFERDWRESGEKMEREWKESKERVKREFFCASQHLRSFSYFSIETQLQLKADF